MTNNFMLRDRLNYITNHMTESEQKSGAVSLIMATLLEDLDEFKLWLSRVDVNYITENTNYSALNIAAKFGFTEKAKLILDHPDFDGDKDDQSILIALKESQLEVFKLLENHPSYPHKYKNNGRLRLAAASGSIAMVKHLIDLGDSPVSTNDKILENPLTQLAYSKNAEQVSEIAEFLIKNGAIDGEYAKQILKKSLMSSITYKNDALVTILLKYGANPSEVTAGLSLIEQSVRYGNTASCKLLIEAGATLGPFNINNSPMILIAAEMGNNSLCQLLIKHGADVNEIFKDNTALTKAISSKKYKTAALLIKHGALVNVCNEGSDAAINIASVNAIKITALVLKNGADINQLGSQHTPLTGAIANSKLAIAELLIKEGADINAVDRELHTPLMLAAKLNHPTIAAILLAIDADLDVVNKNGNTALKLAQKKLNPAIAAMIENKMLGNSIKQQELNDMNDLTDKVEIKRLRL